ncbi:hypothetical protein NA57DRAFT_70372 [Rhizodiscina lignyota]|uniref:Autophagy-related protein 27 n=1 Tax=Rhizodiscina lignyota TaxID=1504668 RepID=A0A9P4MAM1_9PEZI|nr:hypothetical protein NA57DRAFT_70372 [Rhizodiscina lignyota]
MRPLSAPTIRLCSLLSLPSLILAAASFDCSDIVKDRIRFNLKPLGGPHVVHWIETEELITHNHTYTIDICQPLKRTKGVPADEECPNGARVCGIDYVTGKNDNTSRIEHVVPIAGDFIHSTAGWDPKWQLLKNSGSHADADREGLLIEFNGGKFPFNDKKGVPQKAMIEMVCDKDRSGLEGDEEDDRPKEDGDEKEKRDDEGEEKGEEGEKKNKSLTFVSYKQEGDPAVGVLRLEWKTKYACEDAVNNPDLNPKDGWGFFTWFLIILFLCISAYLIFGSWLNYNRYGARGWDLLPHGDTIRDIPYLVKDWGRRVVSTIQGPGSRGGYSAV